MSQATRGRGFEVVRTLPGDVLAMTSPAADELWIAEKGADGKVQLEHKSGRHWSTIRLGLSATYGATLDSTAKHDVWLTADSQLWHFNGHRWSRFPVPDVSPGVRGGASVVAVEPGSAVTIAYGSHISQWTRHGWRTLPTIPMQPFAGWSVPFLRVVDGHVVAVWRNQAPSPYFVDSLWAFNRGSWTKLTDLGGANRTYSDIPKAWLAFSPTEHLFLGVRGYLGSGPTWASCTWFNGVKKVDEPNRYCPAPSGVGGAAQLTDGRLVLGGYDVQPPGVPAVPGVFALYDHGRYSKLSGDPGTATVALVTEPGTTTAWAATTTGTTTYLQTCDAPAVRRTHH